MESHHKWIGNTIFVALCFTKHLLHSVLYATNFSIMVPAIDSTIDVLLLRDNEVGEYFLVYLRV